MLPSLNCTLISNKQTNHHILMKGKKKNKDSNMQQERNHRISIQTFEEGKPCHFN